MQRTKGRLADGREIIWYDAGDHHRTPAVDRRDLPEAVTSSQLRRDPLTGEWIAIASHRQTRTYLPPADECPLCPSRTHLSEVPSTEYQVVAFENRFPSFAVKAEALDAVTDGMEQSRAGVGRCEVVCFTSDHDSTFAALTPAQARLVVDAWADRTCELSQLEAVEHVFPFENRGREIGVTLQHPHGQIYAYPFVPPRAAQELAAATEHHSRTGRSLFGDIIDSEIASGERVVTQNEHWVAFVPFAARWPIEVHFYPRRQVPDLPALGDAERDSFATIYLDVLRRFDRLYSEPTPYIAAWQQAPVRRDREVAWLHLELYSIRRGEGKVKALAGSESGQGAFVNDGLPEALATRLREVAR